MGMLQTRFGPVTACLAYIGAPKNVGPLRGSNTEGPSYYVSKVFVSPEIRWDWNMFIYDIICS